MSVNVYTCRHSMMSVYYLLAGQYRAYCEPCDLGLNWYADADGRTAAERYAERHRCAARP